MGESNERRAMSKNITLTIPTIFDKTSFSRFMGYVLSHKATSYRIWLGNAEIRRDGKWINIIHLYREHYYIGTYEVETREKPTASVYYATRVYLDKFFEGIRNENTQ